MLDILLFGTFQHWESPRVSPDLSEPVVRMWIARSEVT